MAARQQVAVPAQHRVRLHQQPEPAQHVSGRQCSRAARNTRSLGSNRGTPYEPFLSGLAQEIVEDRKVAEGVVKAAGMGPEE